MKQVERGKSLEKILSGIGISMPVDFPSRPHEEILHHCQPKMVPNPPLPRPWEEFLGAWNAVAYRFRAMAEHDDCFTAAIARTGFIDQFVQERELFNFFVSGLSVIDSFAYGLHFLASVNRCADFPINNLRDINVHLTTLGFQRAYGGHAIAAQLLCLEKDPLYKEWKEIRNVLAHRCVPGRIVNIGSGGRIPDDEWKLNGIRLNSTTSTSRRTWIAEVLTRLLNDTNEFVVATL